MSRPAYRCASQPSIRHIVPPGMDRTVCGKDAGHVAFTYGASLAELERTEGGRKCVRCVAGALRCAHLEFTPGCPFRFRTDDGRCKRCGEIVATPTPSRPEDGTPE